MGKLLCHKLYSTTVTVDFHCHVIFTRLLTLLYAHKIKRRQCMKCREVQHSRLPGTFHILPLFIHARTITRQWKVTLTENITVEFRSSWGKENGFEWLSCVITSDEQISPPSPVCKQNSSHLHPLRVGILFNRTALGILLCETSHLYILKTGLGIEIYSSDVYRHKSYCWFATTWQGGHVGGQYNRIFSRRIYIETGFSSQRREMLLFLTTNMAAVTSRARGMGTSPCAEDSGVVWVDKSYFWLVYSCLKYHQLIITNAYPPKRSPSFIHTIPKDFEVRNNQDVRKNRG